MMRFGGDVLTRPLFDDRPVILGPQRLSAELRKSTGFVKDHETMRKCNTCKSYIRREKEKCPFCHARTPRGHLFKNRDTRLRIKKEERR